VNADAREALPGWIALLVVAALAWRRTLVDAAMMGDAPGTMGMPLLPFLGMWVPMMAAMMLPAITPVAALWARSISREPRQAERIRRLLLFATGYLLVWAAAGALAFALIRPIEFGLEAGVYSARTAASGIFGLAGLYQLSPLREACLAHCRSPMTVLGVATAGPAAMRDLRAGAVHGGWCLACCWSLMAVLALVGLMNVAAMVGLAVFIFVEKTTRFGAPAGRVAGVLMIAAAVGTFAIGA
jgi:predicted metal-binding membrane protein